MISNEIRFRTACLFCFFAAGYTFVLINLGFIQIINRSFFYSLGTNQYQLHVTQLPARAPILDRTGAHYLATNSACISAFLVPNQTKQSALLTDFLQKNFPQAADRLSQNRTRSFMYLKRRLTDEDVELIKQANLDDIHLLQESSRFYPLPSATPLVGFTDIDNIGRAGIEAAFNEQLTGKASTVCLEKDARSGYFYFKKQITDTGTQSTPIQLTIDGSLQFLVDEELAAACNRCNAPEGAALIMDPQNGDLLALSSYPASMPHSTEFDVAHMKSKAVCEQYELGSVMKVFTALAALEERLVYPDEPIDCKNCTRCTIDGRIINTVAPRGIIPFSEVIAFSNNIGIVQVAKRLQHKLYDHYERLGFGKKTGISLPAEASGFINHPSNWSAHSIISLSYGYEISGTLLQLARAFSLIAHDGKMVQPRLTMHDPITISDEPLYGEESIQAIRDIMQTTAEKGTGWRARIPGCTVYIKTGTANTLVNGVYDHSKNIYTAAAIIEKDGYQRVIITFIKHADMPNAYASTIAVPLLRRIAEKMIIHERCI
jgi:cell division protein FtsI (penicillin-binding protein 3)